MCAKRFGGIENFFEGREGTGLRDGNKVRMLILDNPGYQLLLNSIQFHLSLSKPSSSENSRCFMLRISAIVSILTSLQKPAQVPHSYSCIFPAPLSTHPPIYQPLSVAFEQIFQQTLLLPLLASVFHQES